MLQTACGFIGWTTQPALISYIGKAVDTIPKSKLARRGRLQKGFRRPLCVMRMITLCFHKDNRIYACCVNSARLQKKPRSSKRGFAYNKRLADKLNVFFEYAVQGFARSHAVKRDAVVVGLAGFVHTGEAQGVGVVVPHRALQLVGVN